MSLRSQNSRRILYCKLIFTTARITNRSTDPRLRISFFQFFYMLYLFSIYIYISICIFIDLKKKEVPFENLFIRTIERMSNFNAFKRCNNKNILLK